MGLREPKQLSAPSAAFLSASGTWTADQPSALHEFAMRLYRARLASSDFGPAQAAEIIEQNGFTEAFGRPEALHFWRFRQTPDGEVPTTADDWPGVPCSTSAGELVKRATMRRNQKNGQLYWPDDGRQADPVAVHAMFAELTAKVVGVA